MSDPQPSWIERNFKELLFFLMTWAIGWYLFFSVIGHISPGQLGNSMNWAIFYTSLFLLFLPFIKKIEFGKIFVIEREIKETKEELRHFKSDTREQFNNLLSNVNSISQRISHSVVVNTAPNAQVLKEEKEGLQQKYPQQQAENDRIKEQLSIEEGGEEWVWIYNLLRIRVEIEKALREIFSKRLSVADQQALGGIKFLSISKLFTMYIQRYPDSKRFERPFKLFTSVANAGIHGQRISEQQYNEALGLGTYVLGDIKIRLELGDNPTGRQ